MRIDDAPHQAMLWTYVSDLCLPCPIVLDAEVHFGVFGI